MKESSSYKIEHLSDSEFEQIIAKFDKINNTVVKKDSKDFNKLDFTYKKNIIEDKMKEAESIKAEIDSFKFNLSESEVAELIQKIQYDREYIEKNKLKKMELEKQTIELKKQIDLINLEIVSSGVDYKKKDIDLELYSLDKVNNLEIQKRDLEKKVTEKMLDLRHVNYILDNNDNDDDVKKLTNAQVKLYNYKVQQRDYLKKEFKTVSKTNQWISHTLLTIEEKKKELLDIINSLNKSKDHYIKMKKRSKILFLKEKDEEKLALIKEMELLEKNFSKVYEQLSELDNNYFYEISLKEKEKYNKIHKLKKENKELLEQMDDYDNSFEIAMIALQKNLDEFNSRSETIEVFNTELTKSNVEFEGKFFEQEKSFNNSLIRLKRERRNIEKGITSLKYKIKSYSKSNVATLQNSVNGLKNKLNVEEVMLEEKNKEIENVRKQIEEIASQEELFASNNVEISKQIQVKDSAIDKQITSIVEDMNKIQKINVDRKSINNLKIIKNDEEIHKIIEDHEMVLKKMEAEYTDKRNALSYTVDDAKEEWEEKEKLLIKNKGKQNIGKLSIQYEISELDKKIKKFKNILSSRKTETQEYQKQLSDNNKDLSTIKEKLAKVENDLKHLDDPDRLNDFGVAKLENEKFKLIESYINKIRHITLTDKKPAQLDEIYKEIQDWVVNAKKLTLDIKEAQKQQ